MHNIRIHGSLASEPTLGERMLTVVAFSFLACDIGALIDAARHIIGDVAIHIPYMSSGSHIRLLVGLPQVSVTNHFRVLNNIV